MGGRGRGSLSPPPLQHTITSASLVVPGIIGAVSWSRRLRERSWEDDERGTDQLKCLGGRCSICRLLFFCFSFSSLSARKKGYAQSAAGS